MLKELRLETVAAQSPFRTIFWLTSFIYMAAILYFCLSLWAGKSETFSLFGTPGSYVIFSYAMLTLSTGWRLITLLGGVLAELLRFAALKTGGMDLGNIDLLFRLPMGFGYGLGLSATAALWFAAAPWRAMASNYRLQTLAELMIFQVVLLYAFSAVQVASVIPYTFEDRVYHFDLGLGVNLAGQVGRLFGQWPLLGAVSILCYNMPAAVIIGVELWQRQSCNRRRPSLLAAAAIACAFSILYFVVPTCSPNQTFGALYPGAMPEHDFGAYTLHPDRSFIRNAMPSLHTVWAILIWIHLRYFQSSKAVAVMGTFYALLVVIATLGMGEHYLADLIVAVPLSLIAQALVLRPQPSQTAPRYHALAAGVLMTSVWLWLICFSSTKVAAPVGWAMIAATILVSYLLFRRLISGSMPQKLRIGCIVSL